MTDSASYLRTHDVEAKIAAAVAQAIKARPPDPVKFIGQYLLSGGHSTKEEMMLAEIDKMSGPNGFDVIIVCCSNQAAEDFWQKRLESTVQQVTGAQSAVLCVHEDWNGGAGNGLGTLYAFQKACAKGAARGLDVAAMMEASASVALYHTAGKGTRLAPLPGAENNNKPGVKLPSLLSIDGENTPITVLECVMRQTSSYASVRKGRCSVFWGDQIFVPCGIQPSSKPADILAALRPMPTKEEWEAEELHQYGLIAVDSKGGATQLEKVTYETAKAYLPPDVEMVGTSLGSFSVSASLMKALREEFAPELKEKQASFDSDPHFWMPLTLKEMDYVAVMAKKGTPEADAKAHYARMERFRQKFDPNGGSILACVDVGTEAYWWDYGRLGLYIDNNALLTQESHSAHALRTFFGITERQKGNVFGGPVHVDSSAVVLQCSVAGGRVGKGSVLVNVSAPSVDVEGCILVNVTSSVPIVGKQGVLYNVVHDAASGQLEASSVRADVFCPGGEHLIINSGPEIDGGKVWKEKLDGNPLSFEGVYKKNLELDVGECTAIAAAAHVSVRAKMK